MKLDLGDTKLLIQKCKKYGLLRNQAAYLLATAFHETAHTMKPVREYGGDAYLRKKKYWPYVGMGYVQLTWDYNYKKAGLKLGVDFLSDPKLLLQPKYASEIIVLGMKEGWFTGKNLDRYITLQKSDYLNARRIINGLDKNELIASYAKEYDELLKEQGYGTEKLIDILPEPVEEKEDIKSPPVPEKSKASPAPSIGEIITMILKLIFARKS